MSVRPFHQSTHTCDVTPPDAAGRKRKKKNMGNSRRGVCTVHFTSPELQLEGARSWHNKINTQQQSAYFRFHAIRPIFKKRKQAAKANTFCGESDRESAHARCAAPPCRALCIGIGGEGGLAQHLHSHTRSHADRQTHTHTHTHCRGHQDQQLLHLIKKKKKKRPAKRQALCIGIGGEDGLTQHLHSQTHTCTHKLP
ncbi:hypothetical protein T492DRAFT_429385 [Pavlovales sp. CCMP2436]|nr:hypothetical protein T492DRAFT_429385 [Pavlovales sp. CCMP2436]